MNERPAQTRATADGPDGPISYLAAGPIDGPLMVFVHGWPSVAATWQPQLNAFSSRGYRVIAPDLRGVGSSSAPTDPSAYAQRHLVADMHTLLRHLGHDKAIWVCHDWGSATVWALAAHHPEACVALVSLCVPYRTLERGKAEMLKYVNRDIYPADKYPDAQFDYITYYQEHTDDAIAAFEAQTGEYLRAFYRRGNPDAMGVPAPSAQLTRNGGWFGGEPAPDKPFDTHVLTADLYDELHQSFRHTGFSRNIGLYLNDDDNLAYSNESVNEGRLDLPVLFIEAGYDSIADTAVSRLRDPMREFCTNLTETSVNAGHWIALERPNKVNDTVAHWLRRTLN
ncbi:soluble epoxide hydrolase/lipid-phosphate phosphatase [Kibdelosporangium banguiense]|uniref:Soluble epoxide hydrolase/lipid-phosphate phosphatase n=1 Tax=Kibdelosporangium banguiense TaxID=1365924 RepID=A0ABS4TTJ4_9PSEU|nr:alpha/beta hydrolase [Kibdelosporangium banguiense]MBP2327726.1 soluble epoxide hydrolase/lipid-phosphate phosphatase [Kibdelosporangium banguiense]